MEILENNQPDSDSDYEAVWFCTRCRSKIKSKLHQGTVNGIQVVLECPVCDTLNSIDRGDFKESVEDIIHNAVERGQKLRDMNPLEDKMKSQ